MPETAFDRHGSVVRWSEVPGEAPAIVFLHGLGGTGSGAFANVVRHPALGGRRAIVIDLPGHGASDRPSDFDYTLDSFASAVGTVLDDAGLDEVDLVGHSMGGSVAITVAAAQPNRVRVLVVAEANLDPLSPSPTGLGSQRISVQGEDDWVAGGYDAMLDSAPTWRPTLVQCDPRAVHRSAVGLVRGTSPTMREHLVSLGMPRTFIRGDRGDDLPDPEGLEAAGVRIVTIPDAGHMMMFDAPTGFVAALADALRR